MWKNLGEGNPTEAYKFFLVRKKGLHPASGEKFIPTTVQMIDGELYTSDNELEPIIFSHKDDVLVPSTNPMECGLEWHPIPE